MPVQVSKVIWLPRVFNQRLTRRPYLDFTNSATGNKLKERSMPI